MEVTEVKLKFCSWSLLASFVAGFCLLGFFFNNKTPINSQTRSTFPMIQCAIGLSE